MRFVLTCFASLALALAVLAASPATAQIACGDTLGPGGSFVLQGDLSCATPRALTLVGPVKVDLGNHTITCTSGGLVGIRLDGKGASLRNGSIEGCDNGVEVFGVGRHKVSQLAIRGGTNAGVYTNSPGNRISDVDVAFTIGTGFLVAFDKQQLDRCSATQVATGFDLQSGSGHRLRDIAVHFTIGVGVVVAANATRLERVRVSRTMGHGIDVDADDLRMKDVLVTGSIAKGIDANGARLRMQGVRVVSSGSRGVEVGCNGECDLKDVSSNSNGDVGFLFFGSRMRVAKARAIQNATSGIALSGATEVSVQGSTARGNGTFDASDAALGCGTNVWSKNAFGTVSDPCIQ